MLFLHEVFLMASERKLKNHIKNIFYEGEKRPSNKNYLVVLALVIIVGVLFFFIFSQLGIITEQAKSPRIETSSDVNSDVSDMGDILTNASQTLDDLGKSL